MSKITGLDNFSQHWPHLPPSEVASLGVDGSPGCLGRPISATETWRGWEGIQSGSGLRNQGFVILGVRESERLGG